MIVNLIGYLGTIVATISFLPQVIQSYRTKSVGDLSLATLVLLITNVTLWLVYGVLIHATPLIITNLICGTIIGYQLYLKLTYSRLKTDNASKESHGQ